MEYIYNEHRLTLQELRDNRWVTVGRFYEDEAFEKMGEILCGTDQYTINRLEYNMGSDPQRGCHTVVYKGYDNVFRLVEGRVI